MVSNQDIPSDRLSRRKYTSIILLTLFFITTRTQAENYDIDDEEIVFEPRRSLFEHQHKAEKQTASQIVDAADNRMQSASQTYRQDDPFAVTFEDFIKDEKSSKAPSQSENTKDISVAAISDQANVIIDEDENFIQQTQKDRKIDYIFPQSKQEMNRNHEHEKQSGHFDAGDKSTDEVLLEEIRLLFAWKESPTNKCTKSCGKGHKLKRLTCVDLKYDVKVENELCLKSNVLKPNETSLEPCNEIDCPPQWLSVEFQECTPFASQDGACRPTLYKRVECTMVNSQGILIHLDDSRCDGLKKQEQQTSHLHHEKREEEPKNSKNSDLDEYVITTDETNEIPLNVNSEESSYINNVRTVSHPHNEPFFQADSWSECGGAPCGQLGKRSRRVSCRLYLSRSSRFTELPNTSCHNIQKPDTEEPCYMDCASESYDNQKNNISETSINDGDNTDEVIYDLELSRYIWRADNWTKCNAECLGGQHERIIECWDKIARVLVDSSLCDRESKPQVSTAICNNIPCTPEWKTELFSKCSRPCGSVGIKTRSVVCVQQVPMQDGSSSSLLVSNDLCLQANITMPDKIEPCNRIDCQPEWKVGPWSKCSKDCGYGIRNRTVICEQEFANKEGPKQEHHQRRFSPDLLEAISMSSKEWYPGKATQVPFQECYNEYMTVPSLDEKCFSPCEDFLIDADREQDFQVHDASRRKTITLKIGGKARLMEGKTLKIRCRLYSRHADLVKSRVHGRVEWFKDGIKIFMNGSRVAEKQYNFEQDLFLANDLIGDDRNQFMADDPNLKKTVTKPAINFKTTQARRRSLRTRSSEGMPAGSYQFIPLRGGRFSLVKDNALRIKRLRTDDTGIYTCAYGSSEESLDLRVTSEGDSAVNEEQLIDLGKSAR